MAQKNRNSPPPRPQARRVYEETITVWVGPELKKAVEALADKLEYRSVSDYGRDLFRREVRK